MEPVKLPIEDVLDLHTFDPRDISDLLEDYFSECIRAGIFSIRVIHGKGRGVLKKRVHAFLEKSAVVKCFTNAPPESGGWGATLVQLKNQLDNSLNHDRR
jgi:DNA-nicking Smr family endonuclease